MTSSLPISMSTPLIEARGIRKSFNRAGSEVSVLRGLDLQIFPGESVCVTGSSGAGKSTLLHILGTLDRPSGGELRFLGKEVGALDDDSLAQFRGEEMGFVFQFHHLLAELTALENVMLPLQLTGAPASAAREPAEKWLRQLGLGHRLTHYPSEMSGGEQQRVALARAVVRGPKVIFADEPTGNLDSQSSQVVQELLFQLRREHNMTLVVVTHDQRFASRFSRQLQLQDGSFRPIAGGL